MTSNAASLTSTTVAFALVMFVLDLLTSTTALHYRKARTMFTLTISDNGYESTYTVADIATGHDVLDSYADDSGINAARTSAEQIAGRILSGFTGDQVGTWSIVPAATPGHDVRCFCNACTGETDFTALEAERAAAGELLVTLEDVDPAELALILTDAEIDGWARVDVDGWDQDADDDYGDFLESVYSDPMEWDDVRHDVDAGEFVADYGTYR